MSRKAPIPRDTDLIMDFLPLYLLVDLLAVYGHFFRCLDSESDFIAANVNDGHYDVVVDYNALIP
jgi:hypothetical protein